MVEKTPEKKRKLSSLKIGHPGTEDVLTRLKI